MDNAHDHYQRLYALHDMYSEAVRRYEETKRGGFFAKNLLSLPQKARRQRLAREIIRAYGSLDGLEPLSGDPSLVVSLTSFPARIGGLHLVIRSLMVQTVRPGKIVIYLSADEFPRRYDSLPAQLRGLRDSGVEVRFVPGNIRSHKKYHYAFRDFPESVVMTADDDIIYPHFTIERLAAAAARHPGAVCANIVRRIGIEAASSCRTRSGRSTTTAKRACRCSTRR